MQWDEYDDNDFALRFRWVASTSHRGLRAPWHGTARGAYDRARPVAAGWRCNPMMPSPRSSARETLCNSTYTGNCNRSNGTRVGVDLNSYLHLDVYVLAPPLSAWCKHERCHTSQEFATAAPARAPDVYSRPPWPSTLELSKSYSET
eukprot:5932781-Pyramimonas_sp.AAC.1